MHKAIYCVCMLYEHSTKSDELLYAFSLYIGTTGADILGVLGYEGGHAPDTHTYKQ